MLERFECPYCKGSGFDDELYAITTNPTYCDFCDGTGFATDDSDDPMFSYDKDW